MNTTPKQYIVDVQNIPSEGYRQLGAQFTRKSHTGFGSFEEAEAFARRAEAGKQVWGWQKVYTVVEVV